MSRSAISISSIASTGPPKATSSMLQGLPRHLRFQLQIQRGPHVFDHEAGLHRAAPRRHRSRDENLAHRAQRRHLHLRFGDPAYAREFLRQHPPATRSPASTWDRTATAGAAISSNEPGPGPRPLVMEKQWYSFLMWGASPTIPRCRFPLRAGPRRASHRGLLSGSLQRAPECLAGHAVDHAIFLGRHRPEMVSRSCWSHPRRKGGGGFYTVRHFMEGNTMPDRRSSASATGAPVSRAASQ